MKNVHRLVLRYLTAVALFALSASAPAQDPGGGYVSRKEYEELKQQMLALKKELDALKKERTTVAAQKTPEQAPATPKATGESGKAVAEPFSMPQLPTLGTTKILITGDMEATFEARNRSNSTFSAAFNPIFLWELTPKLLFEGHLEFELGGEGTDVSLQYAQLSYLLNDY